MYLLLSDIVIASFDEDTMSEVNSCLFAFTRPEKRASNVRGQPHRQAGVAKIGAGWLTGIC